MLTLFFGSVHKIDLVSIFLKGIFVVAINQVSMKELKEYIKKAKAGNWALDLGSLAQEYGVTVTQVRQCVAEVWGY
mgnify:FL=1